MARLRSRSSSSGDQGTLVISTPSNRRRILWKYLTTSVHTRFVVIPLISLHSPRGELFRLVFTFVPTVPLHIDKPIRFPSVPGEGHLLNGIGGWRGQKRAPGE
jgi:hypothetical protein